MPRYLSKSRFKIALDCPTKLYYTGKEQYPDTKADDAFLEALAEGGYQVGELAKCYFPNGHDITESGYDMPLKRTLDLLKQDKVTIYEAAFKFENLFIRADILVKNGNDIELHEVKAKSFSGKDEQDFYNKNGYLDNGWKEYVYDVAFQKYVITQAFPEWKVKAFLMLADKNATATVNGLNQKFQLVTNESGRTHVQIVGGISDKELGQPILKSVNVDNLLTDIYTGKDSPEPTEKTFTEHIHYLAEHYEQDKKIYMQVSKHCQHCEFKADNDELTQGKKSGFNECWLEQTALSSEQLAEPLIFDIWNFRRKQHLMDEGVFLLTDVKKEMLGDVAPNSNGTLSSKERQWMQIEKFKNNDQTPYIDKDGLKDELNSFTYPLHFIDFETSMVAIPFYKDKRPYEQTAFQFSHHQVQTDGTITHKGQYLCTEKGKFPNLEFLRALKSELENDKGTVFKYAAHENTVLNQIAVQIEETPDAEIPDKASLISFIQEITHGANHCGERDMVDMLELVKQYYYHPAMGGSNSIKAVLPAVLNGSDFIQKKYSHPIYGKNAAIKSLNFEDAFTWIKYNTDGSVISPYKLLPNLFDDLDTETVDSFISSDKLADGGAAMTAYAKMQFTQISDLERERIIQGLLKYCELDTLAMVMIWEHWKNEITH